MRLSRYIAAFCIGMYLIALSGCDLAYPAVEGQFDRTLNVTGMVNLDVSTGSGSIAIRAGSASAVQIHGLIRAGEDWRSNAQEKVRYLEANPPIEQNGNVIRIGRIDNAAYRNNVSISYEIIVPAETQVRSKTGSGGLKVEGIRRPVDASTGSGSIAMDNIGNDVIAHTGSGSIELDQITGKVEARTGSGSIRGERIAGSVKADTGSGSITLAQTSAERGAIWNVEVSTGSGSIDVSGVNGPLRAESGSGGITVTGNPAGDWELDASSGAVTLHLDANAAFDLYARSSSSRISVDQPVTVTGTLGKHEIRGKVRGGGHLIDVRTGSGSINIH
ncbi:MAG: DUF4097 domain-containing protein [Acidobacteriia bacterium]|nr:DUF4097 domain-containing protein [Terriglobia bacterium]